MADDEPGAGRRGEVLALLDRRRERYEAVLVRLGADVAVLTSDAAVQHATGARLYTQRLIPERPVVAVVGQGRTGIVAWEWEHAQLAAENPGLELAGFPEFGADPWATVAAEVRAVAGAGSRVIVEGTCPAPAVAALAGAGLRVSWDEGFEGLLSARCPKDGDEIALLAAISRRADEAIASVAAEPLGGLSEREIAALIAWRFRAAPRGRIEAEGIVSGPASNRSNHHLAADRPLEPGVVRLGLKAQVDGYWVLLTRMGWAAEPGGEAKPEPAFASDYAAYIGAHTAGWGGLRAGVPAGEVYALVRARLAARGLRLRSLKVGHGTGLSFREPPILREDDPTPVPPGAVLAVDFAVFPESTRSGRFIHVEDRILVTEAAPIRLSDASDTSRPFRLSLATATRSRGGTSA